MPAEEVNPVDAGSGRNRCKIHPRNLAFAYNVSLHHRQLSSCMTRRFAAPVSINSRDAKQATKNQDKLSVPRQASLAKA
jgi:hypothetical protein